jgi:hypothetical protein
MNPASAKDSGDGTPSQCVHVAKDLSRIKQVVGWVSRGCPFVYRTLLYEPFKAGLQTLPVLLELLSALAYEVLFTCFPVVVWTYLNVTLEYDAGIGHDTSYITASTFRV